MTTTAAPARTGTGTPRQQASSGRVVADGLAVTRRYLLHWIRQPQLIVFSTIQPVMFVLLFRYVFGGAVGSSLPPGVEYVNYLLPGIFVQSVAFGATQAAVGLATDLQGGIIDRFRSLPMARSAVLIGRTLSDLVRNLFVVLLMTAVGYAVGFRFSGGALGAVGAILIVVLFGFALAWIFSFVGLAVKGGAEGAQAASFVAIFPLVFASSAFVPIATMPSWLATFASHTPVTRVIDASRALVLGDAGETLIGRSAGEAFLIALAWIAAILVVFVPLAVARYRRS
jgi:ABC-2 type transport system permease protein/oleandomycin transport system permease protein